MTNVDLITILAAGITVFLLVAIYALVIAEWRTY